jgi:hypothetical protein
MPGRPPRIMAKITRLTSEYRRRLWRK